MAAELCITDPVHIYTRTSAIFIHIGKLGYKKPIKIYALGTQTTGRQDLSRINILHQSEALLQGQRPIQGSYPRLSSQELYHSILINIAIGNFGNF